MILEQLAMEAAKNKVMILKSCNFKKSNGDRKWKKCANKLGTKCDGYRLKIQLKGCYKREINSKVFAIPILTAIFSTIN